MKFEKSFTPVTITLKTEAEAKALAIALAGVVSNRIAGDLIFNIYTALDEIVDWRDAYKYEGRITLKEV